MIYITILILITLKPEVYEDFTLKPEVYEDFTLKPEVYEDFTLKPEVYEDFTLNNPNSNLLLNIFNKII